MTCVFFFNNMWDTYKFLIKFISTLSFLLKKYMHFTCLRNTCHFYKLSWRKFLQPSLQESFVHLRSCVGDKKELRKNRMCVRVECFWGWYWDLLQLSAQFGQAIVKGLLWGRRLVWANRSHKVHFHNCLSKGLWELRKIV